MMTKRPGSRWLRWMGHRILGRITGAAPKTRRPGDSAELSELQVKQTVQGIRLLTDSKVEKGKNDEGSTIVDWL